MASSAAPGVSIERFGVANPSTSITTASILDGTQYVVTRSVEPTLLAGVDLATDRVCTHHRIPDDDGSWATVAYEGCLYVGTYLSANLYRFDPGAEIVDRVAEFPDDEFVWDLATDGERIYAGTWPTGRVLSIDPQSGDVRSLGVAVDGEDYVRCLRVDGDTLYAGVGSHAHLVAFDLATGEREQLLPDRFRSESFVHDLAMVESHVLAGTGPDGYVCSFDRETGAFEGNVDPFDAGAVSELYAGTGETVYVAAQRTGDRDRQTTLQRYDRCRDAVEEIASFPGGSCCGIDSYCGRLRGAGTHGLVWSCEPDGSDPRLIQLAAAGMPTGAERPQSIATYRGGPVVGGHGRLTVHRPDEGTADQSAVPGEPKAMAVVGDTLYAATYTGAHLVAFDPDAGTSRTLATVGQAQNRPRSLVHDPHTDALLMGTVPEYGHLEGAIVRYDRATGDLDVHRGVVPDQSINSIAVADDGVYLGSEVRGGLGAEPTATAAEFVAWDQEEGTTDWSLTIEGTTALVDMVAHDGSVYATAASASVDARAGVDDEEGGSGAGELVVIDPAERAIVHRKRYASVAGDIASNGREIYAVTGDRLLRIDPGEYGIVTLVDGLEGEWYNWPMLALDGTGTVSTAEGYDLIGVSSE